MKYLCNVPFETFTSDNWVGTPSLLNMAWLHSRLLVYSKWKKNNIVFWRRWQINEPCNYQANVFFEIESVLRTLYSSKWNISLKQWFCQAIFEWSVFIVYLNKYIMSVLYGKIVYFLLKLRESIKKEITSLRKWCFSDFSICHLI